MDHHLHDRVGLELASIIAAGLGKHPEWMTIAHDNLRRWKARNADAPGLMRCYEEWERILGGTIDEIVAALLDPSDNGQRIRTNSPFTGIVGPREVWAIKRRIREECAGKGGHGQRHDQSAA